MWPAIVSPQLCVSCLYAALCLISVFNFSYLLLHPTPSFLPSSLPTTRCRLAASKGRKVRSSLQSVRCARLWYLSPSHAYLELSVFRHDLVSTDNHSILSMKSNCLLITALSFFTATPSPKLELLCCDEPVELQIFKGIYRLYFDCTRCFFIYTYITEVREIAIMLDIELTL